VSGGGVVLYSLVYTMASELEKSLAELNALATVDSLTGLANRRVTLERLSSELTRAGREAHRVGVVIVDIDHFKSINDSYGHAAGDLVLAELASRMRDAMREYDTLGRIGGEEFVVVAPDVGPDDLSAIAERVRAVVGREAIPVGGGLTVMATISAGCALSSEDEKAGEDVLRRADKALYEAKAAGRDRVRMHPKP
jgi:diguanylate cyclase (GGDEF)-like protein